jgi:TetR/AcrR family transcriptional regulator, cholesterol catabolism regulator
MTGQPLSLRERKKQENRARILDAAGDLFQAQGYEHTSMDQVAERANVSRATLFNYFTTKQRLLSALADEELRRLEQRVVTEAALDSAVTQIRETMRTFVRDTMPFFQVTRYVLLDALQHPAGEAASTIRLGDILGRMVRKAQAQGEIRADLDPSEIAHAIVGAYLAALFEWVARAQEQPPASEAMVENIVDMLFEGIAGPHYAARDPKRL